METNTLQSEQKISDKKWKLKREHDKSEKKYILQ